MTKQKGICEECKQEYEYEYNSKYPRKYCPECSAKKKAEYEGRQEPDVPVVKPGVNPVADGTWGGGVPPLPGKHATIYVPYAKDIFCGLLGLYIKSDKPIDMNRTMDMAIELVKQAREGFE